MVPHNVLYTYMYVYIYIYIYIYISVCVYIYICGTVDIRTVCQQTLFCLVFAIPFEGRHPRTAVTARGRLLREEARKQEVSIT